MEEMWEISIMKCISELGGECELQEIYDNISKFIVLKQEHLEIKYERPAYHHQIRAHIQNLLEKGELIRVGRGQYEVTEKGVTRLDNTNVIKL